MDKLSFWDNIRKIDESSEYKALIKGKHVIHIPIVSMSDHVDRIYDLSCDGNINRIITYAQKKLFDYESMRIFLPNNSKNKNFIDRNLINMNNHKIQVIYSNYIANNAKDQRIFRDKLNFLRIKFSLKTHYSYNLGRGEFDPLVDEIYAKGLNLLPLKDKKNSIIFCESQALALILIQEMRFCNYGFPSIPVWYICPTCATDKHERNFQIPYKPYDELLFQKADGIIVVTQEQKDYILKRYPHQNVILLPMLMDRSLSAFDYKKVNSFDGHMLNEFKDKPIVYMPYRLSDSGYKAELIFDALKDLLVNQNKDCYIFVSDPNRSGLLETFINEIPEEFHKNIYHVPSDRNFYYTMLDTMNPIIPYLEDLEFINHCAIFEFMDNRSTANVILKEDIGL